MNFKTLGITIMKNEERNTMEVSENISTKELH